MPNGPTDLWAQARLINPNLVPKYFSRFREQMMIKVTQFKWVPKKGWEDECFKIMRPCIRYTLEDNIDLPPVSYITHQVTMSTKQKKVYDSIMQTCKAQAEEGDIVALNEAVKLGKLLQAATGVVYTSEGREVDLEPKEKLSTLIELIEQSGNKAIVFTPFIHSMKMLEKALARHFSVGVVNGQVSKRKRDTIFSEFQGGDLQVLLAHPKCMAHGLTLTASSNIIWFAPIDSFEIYEQANGRIRRAGQKQHQNIIHLQCSAVERRVYDRLKNKGQMQGILLELLKTN
jgi:SNF2 family DNA or RNA helicase